MNILTDDQRAYLEQARANMLSKRDEWLDEARRYEATGKMDSMAAFCQRRAEGCAAFVAEAEALLGNPQPVQKELL